MRKFNFVLEVKPSLNVVSYIRNLIKFFFVGYDLQVIESIQVCSSELIENAIKYRYVEDGEEDSIKISIELDAEQLEIQVSNKYSAKSENLLRLLASIDRIKSSEDFESLYKERLREIFYSESDTGNRLGLIRIIHECGFKIDYYLSGKTLIIKTRKNIG